MFARLVIAAVLLTCTAGLATAASFDCGKASTPFERAICASDELSKKDEILAKSYATALGGLSKEATEAVKAGQRGWLDYARRACTDDAEPITRGDYTAEQAQCLVSVFNSRIVTLAESRMREGRRIYSIDVYAAVPDPDAAPDSWSKIATKEFSTPRIDATDAEAAAFNALVHSMPVGAYSGEADGTALTDGSTDQVATVQVDAISSRRISLVHNDWWYGHGAAHGNYTISYRHFLTRELREMEPGDIFAGEAWWNPLAQLAFDALVEQLGADGLFITEPREIRETVRAAESWSFSEEGLTIRFQPYEVTAYAAGAPTVTIPWDAINEFMTDDGREIAGVY